MKKSYILIFTLICQTAFGQIISSSGFEQSDTQLSYEDRMYVAANKIQSDASLTNRLDSIQNNFASQVDSLQRSYIQEVDKIQSLTASYRHKADSLSSLKLPAEKYTHKIDSLNSSLTALRENVAEKLNSIKQKANDKLKDLQLSPELRDKLSQLTSKIESVNLSSLENNLPGNFGLQNLTNTLAGTNASLDLPQVDGFKGLGAIPGVEGIKNVTPDLDQVSDITKQAGSLQGQFVDASGNLNQLSQIDRLAESKVSQLEEVKVLQEQTGNLPMGGLGTEQQTKNMLTELVKTLAKDHFAGKEQQIQKAMDEVAKYKAKYESVDKIGDLPKKLPNEMKGKPFMERIVPGIALQIQKRGDDIMVDFNPYAGYRFTGKITAGLGWNQRVVYNTSYNDFNSGATIYGPRVFGEYKLWKGFSPRVEVETMNTNVPPFTRTPTLDPLKNEWVWGAFVGIKKEYKFIKRVKGTASVMMRLFDPQHKSPYADVVNARIGFCLPAAAR